MDINEAIRRLESISIKENVENAIIDTDKKLVGYQKDQMLHGITSTGKKIGKYKSDEYAAKKYQMNSLAGLGYKDEKLTGEFQSAIGVDVRDSSVVFFSSDSKTEDILNRDGEDVFGLSRHWAVMYSNQELKAATIKRIKKSFHGLL